MDESPALARHLFFPGLTRAGGKGTHVQIRKVRTAAGLFIPRRGKSAGSAWQH
jgi:hypothetical protein